VDADHKGPAHESNHDAVFAHGIITFIAPKPAHVFGELTSGPIAVSEIGVQPTLVPNTTGFAVVTGQEVGITFPPRLNEAQRRPLSHVLVIAGSRGKAGVAGLAGMAALSAGADLVTMACPKSIETAVGGFAPELMTEGLKETAEGTISLEASSQLEPLIVGKNVIVLGPGLSANPETAQFVRELITHCSLPLVLDADGLGAFERHYRELNATHDNFRVLIFHPEDAARLLGVSIDHIQSDEAEVARRISIETGSCVVLKGSRTVVAGVSGETWLNLTGNSVLAKSGCGDVLSGMIGAALAKHAESQLQIEDADDQQSQGNSNQASSFLKDINVAAAVYLHGLAGDIARDVLHENTALATDVLESLTEAFRDCDLQMERSLFYLRK
jgi:NAD(P)H-hydrate epimerase